MIKHLKAAGIACISAALLLFQQTASAAEFSMQKGDLGEVSVQLRGSLKDGDAKRIIAAIKTSKPAMASKLRWLNIIISSEGGSVREAMQIGRFLRSENASVTIVVGGKCYSSCVFLLAGAVRRLTKFGSVGLHRPYLERASNGMDFESTYRRTSETIRKYFEEMRVPVHLADVMYSIPPERMKILSAEEADEFFPESDPVYDEIFTAAVAKRYNITSREYRERDALGDRTCPEERGNWECSQAILWGLPIHQYRVRAALVRAVCFEDATLRPLDPKQPGKEDPDACVRYIMLAPQRVNAPG